ncbi:MAG: CmpA/NrtA family ABC transporter substrate-binding protein [Rhizobiaceae bacterium]
MSAMTKHAMTAGFMPLTDSALLVAAKVKGFAEAEDLDLTLVRETSWANIRDRMAVGHFEAAHMLAPMPIASNLGLTPLPLPLIAPMALGLGGNAVTVSDRLWKAMANEGAQPNLDPALNGAALKRVVARRGHAEKLQFAVVHPFSGHGYELRYWLAACEIDPASLIDIVVVPPSMMADAMKTGRIDGYCAGEPWNSFGVENASGHLATVKAAIWKSSPEKVIGVQAGWAQKNPSTLDALLRALHRASSWCADKRNHGEMASILSRPEWINVAPELILRGITGQLETGSGVVDTPDFFVTHDRAATFPWQSHALWFYSQMVRWNHVSASPEHADIAAKSYRPDIYRRALKATGAPLPAANAKVEGALKAATGVGSVQGKLVLGPDGFFDGQVFDPDELDAYIAAQAGNPA